jgi:hypothetical protein
MDHGYFLAGENGTTLWMRARSLSKEFVKIGDDTFSLFFISKILVINPGE